MKIKFDYSEWLKNKDSKVVDESDDEVYFYEYNDRHIVMLNGKAYDPDEAPIYFWVDDPSDHTAKNTQVSDDAVIFQGSTTCTGKEMILDCIRWFLNNIAILFRYDFFRKKMWKDIKEFKHIDDAEIIIAFFHWWIRYQYGFQTMPVGSAWTCGNPTTYKEHDDCYEYYIKKYMPLFIEFGKWMNKQR